MTGIILSGAALSKALYTELISILDEEYSALSGVGDEVESELASGDFKTIAMIEGDHSRWTQHREVITKTPEGKLYKWSYEYGAGDYESSGPNAYGAILLTEVIEKEETIIVKRYQEV